PGERSGRAAAVLDRLRAAGRRPVHREHRGHQQPPGRVDRAVDADRDRLATAPAGPAPAAPNAPVGGIAVAPRPETDADPTHGGSGGGGGWAGTAGVVVAAAVPLAFLATFFAYPVAMLVARGFLTDGALDLGGVAEVFSSSRTWRIVGLTFAQAILGTLGAVLLGVPGAYVLYCRSFPGRTLVRALVTVPFVLPTVVVGVAFRSLLASSGPLGFLGLDGTFTAIVLALVFFNYAVVVRTVGGLWERLDPRTAQAARALGASPARAFLTVTLPALGPAIASAASVVFLFCATAFGVVLVLGGLQFGTVETEIWL